MLMHIHVYSVFANTRVYGNYNENFNAQACIVIAYIFKLPPSFTGGRKGSGEREKKRKTKITFTMCRTMITPDAGFEVRKKKKKNREKGESGSGKVNSHREKEWSIWFF